MHTLTNFINGQLTAPQSGAYLPVYNPALAEVYAQVPDSDSADVHSAINAAKAAFDSWASLTAGERSGFLFQLADAIEARLEDFARAEAFDNGKPLSLARKVDIPRSIQNLRFFASGCQHFASESHAQPGSINYTLRQPLGVVGCISPWNLPLYLLTWKIAPALAAGNCVVAKPSEVTPMTAYLFSELCQEVGLPKGVFNVVHGLGPKTAQVVCESPEIKAVSFTGSTAVGQKIASICAPQFKKYSLEMGGKNAALVFDDCDYDKMLATLLRSGYANQGQICLCTSRILIHKPLYDTLTADLTHRVSALKVGDPLSPDTEQGAVVSEAHLNKIMGFIQQAKASNANLLCGGGALPGPGWFVQPTLISGLDADHPLNQQEIFGPVTCLIPFEDEAEALKLANATEYGLTASVWTQDLSRAQRVSQALETGMVWVNTWMNRDLRTPFGGIKSSGVGREGGWEVFRFFTQPKNVCIEY